VYESSLGIHEIKLTSLEKTSAMAVEFEIIETALITLARSPPGTTVGG
jgi:hypothetical protein